MINRRRSVQEAHERFQVGLLIEELDRRHRSKFRVIAEPNPPEAIIQSGNTTRWVEVTTAFFSANFAKDLYSHATDGEVPAPMDGIVIAGPDAQFSANFVDVVKQKLEKATYAQSRKLYGPGYLVVSIQYPFFGQDTPKHIRNAWSKLTVHDLGCFRSIYITYRTYDGYKVTLWRPPPRDPVLCPT